MLCAVRIHISSMNTNKVLCIQWSTGHSNDVKKHACAFLCQCSFQRVKILVVLKALTTFCGIHRQMQPNPLIQEVSLVTKCSIYLPSRKTSECNLKNKGIRVWLFFFYFSLCYYSTYFSGLVLLNMSNNPGNLKPSF